MHQFKRGDFAMVEILDRHPGSEDTYLIQAERGIYTLHGSSLMPLPNELDVGDIVVAATKWRRAQQLQVKAYNENQRASAAAERNQAERELAVAVDRYAARLAPVDLLAMAVETLRAQDQLMTTHFKTPDSIAITPDYADAWRTIRAAILLIERSRKEDG